nr:MAG TPA: hypothetical protein [Crassvirales sp.]
MELHFMHINVVNVIVSLLRGSVRNLIWDCKVRGY